MVERARCAQGALRQLEGVGLSVRRSALLGVASSGNLMDVDAVRIGSLVVLVRPMIVCHSPRSNVTPGSRLIMGIPRADGSQCRLVAAVLRRRCESGVGDLDRGLELFFDRYIGKRLVRAVLGPRVELRLGCRFLAREGLELRMLDLAAEERMVWLFSSPESVWRCRFWRWRGGGFTFPILEARYVTRMIRRGA